MKSYGKKFLKGKMGDVSLGMIETRDAVLWDVLPLQRLCRVKIQGSNTLITAHYPENWEQTPFWMKAGNAVRITHMGGKRGRIEIVGCGQLIPTPVSGNTLPTPATPSDAVLTGGHVGVSIPNAMTVDVEAASYRINGVTYNSAADTLAIAAAPAVGQYRYDVIYGDTAGAVAVVTGTPAASNPVMPSLPNPATQIQLGYVLVYGGMTEVTVNYTNREWKDEFAASVTVTPTDGDLDWAELSTTVRVQVFDQYGNPITTGMPGWHMRLEFATIGNGTIAPAEDDSGANSYYDFTYTRDQLATDISPVLKGTCEAPERDISGYTNIILRDAGGLPMSGQVDVPAYTTIQDEGVPLTQREVINFKGAGVTAADNAGTGVTDVTIPGGGGGGDVVGPAGATDSDICEFDTATGKLIKDGNLAHADVADAVSKKHVAATAGTGIDVAGQVISLDERNANLVLFPEYAGATMSPSGANNNPGIYGMTSDFEAIGTSIYNYYEWKSSITTGLQSYDINVKIPMPFNFTDLQVGVSVALTMDIKTEENDEANDSIDITLQRDGNAATSALTDQHSAVAATWVAVGFDETDAVLAALAAGDILNVTIRMYSQNSKYARVGKINLQVKLQ